MKIATFNVNGVNARLPVLLRWLEKARPEVACLQELKAPDEKFPAAAVEAAGYGAIWHGQKSWNGVAILARGAQPRETRRGLPGDPDDSHSRYIEAEVGGILIGSEEPIYTFWDYFRNAFGRNDGIRIDHLLLSPHLAGRLAVAGVDIDARGWEKASDHAPTWVTLGAGPGKSRSRSRPAR